MKPSTLGIIPARAGSKGVPNKNIRPLAGKPLVAYTCDAANASPLDRVVISTDSHEIADVGRQRHIEVPFLRPAELASDTAKAIDVVQHTLEFFRAEEGWAPDMVLYLQPTSPFRTADQISEALDTLAASSVDSVVSLAPASDHPAFVYLVDGSQKLIDALDPRVYRKERRQDLHAAYRVDCCILGSYTSYLVDQAASGGSVVNLNNFVPYYTQSPASIDINEWQDFLFAEFMMGQGREFAT